MKYWINAFGQCDAKIIKCRTSSALGIVVLFEYEMIVSRDWKETWLSILLGKSWVTKEKKHAHYVLRKWTWLISNWSHANADMRFDHCSLPNRWSRGTRKLLTRSSTLYCVSLSWVFTIYRYVFGAGTT